MTTIKKISLTLLLLVVLVPTSAVIFIQLPPVQMFLCNTVVKKLSGVLNGDISIGKIYLSLPNNIIVKDVVVTQKNGCDTVANIGKLLLHAGTTSLLTEHAHIHKIAIEKGFVDIDRISGLVKKKDQPQASADKELKQDTSLLYGFRTISLDRLHLADLALSKSCSDTTRKKIDRTKRPRKVDWKEFSFSQINLDMTNLLWNDSLTAVFKNLQAKEEHGWNVQTFKGNLTMTGQEIRLTDFQYDDGYSNLVANHLNMSFESLSKFSDFCHNVTMDVDFNNTLLDFNSLAFFGCSDHIKLKLFVTGRVVGPVSRLNSDKLIVYSGTKKTRLELIPNIIGLPNSKATMASVKIKKLTTDMEDVAQIVSEVTKSDKFKKTNISRFAPGETFSFNGSLDGLFTDFVAHGSLGTTSTGGVEVDIICRADKELGYTLDGYMESHGFDVGSFLQSDDFGKLYCDGAFQMFTGRTKKINLDRLYIDEIKLGKRIYTDINIAGLVSKKGINVRVDSDDKWIKFGFDLNMFNTDLDNMEMDVEISSLRFFDSLGVHNAGNIGIFAVSHPNGSHIGLESGIANLSFKSEIGLASYFKKLKNHSYGGVDAEITVTLEQINQIANVFVPKCFIEPGTEFHYSWNNTDGGKGYLKSDLLAYGNNFIKGFDADINVDSHDRVNVILQADTLQSGNVIAKKSSIDLDVIDKDDFSFSTVINDSRFLVGDTIWSIGTRSLDFKKGLLSLDGLRIFSGDHIMAANGTLGNRSSDTLKVVFNNMDLSKFNFLIGNNLKLGGTLNGKADIISFFGESKGCIADLQGDSLSINGNRYGQLNLLTEWNQALEQFDISLVNTMNGRRRLDLLGYYKPLTRDIDLAASFDSLHLSVIAPFTKSVVSDLSGFLFGDIRIIGENKEYSVTSNKFFIDNAGFKLLYTQVDYSVSGPVGIDNRGVHLEGLVISDSAGHTGSFDGGLTYNNLKDLYLDTRIRLNNIMGLNTSLLDNNSFYGKAYATGSASLTGPLDDIVLDINASTDANTAIHIPIASYGKEQASILQFISDERQFSSSYDSLRRINNIASLKTARKKSMKIDLDIETTPDAELLIEIDRTTGDILKTRGSGDISISAGGPENKFDIRGNYVVNSGSFKFTLVGGILSRDFTLTPGGTISMTGDIMQSNLDMMANYRTKASLSSLIQDTTASGTRRTVNCGIGITGILSNPQLAFSVDIPDLDPTTLGRVQSALNTEEKRMKQVLALLLSGSFVPSEQGGIVNSTTVLYSNVSEIMSNQFNNIFRQLEIPLDLGFKYQPTNDGRDMFDVAVSTQLFNNRVTINGNIGNRTYSTASSSTIVGDVDVSIKLNSSGKLQLNLFSHSADQYSSYLDQAQRNGAGIVYQEEFNTFKELWRKIFWSRKRREKEELKQVQPEKKEENEKK